MSVFSLDLHVGSVLDDVTSDGREFHVRDAAAGKARSCDFEKIWLLG